MFCSLSFGSCLAPPVKLHFWFFRFPLFLIYENCVPISLEFLNDLLDILLTYIFYCFLDHVLVVLVAYLFEFLSDNLLVVVLYPCKYPFDAVNLA